ncbi:MAG: sugar ABC transporter permease [Treponema sp.]|jgi:multiple sugar transport system permease protein|nr:sugar ABC transporter permease [Treponema sp.]
MKNSVMRIGRSEIKEWTAAYLFLLPWIIGMVVFFAYPFLHSLILSFTNSMLRMGKLTGFENFVRMFTRDENFVKSLQVTSRYALLGIPLKLIFALLLALLLKKGATFYRTAYYVPSLIGSSIAVAVMWKQLFSKEGIISQVGSLLGVEPRAWLGDPAYALNILIILAVWQFGSSMVIFIAGLKNIPAELYEAATIDGAGPLRSFRHITLPMLSSVIQFNLVLQLIGGFQAFTQGYVITGGGPVNETLFTVQHIYMTGFSGTFRLGYASAMSWTLFALIAVVTAVIFISSKYWVFYADER